MGYSSMSYDWPFLAQFYFIFYKLPIMIFKFKLDKNVIVNYINIIILDFSNNIII